MVVRRERYVVIEAVVVRAIGALLALLRCLLLLAWLLTCRPSLRLLLSIWSAAQQLHHALHIHHNFRGVALDSVFFPLSGL